MRLTSSNPRVYHAYLRIDWGDAPATTMFIWSHDEAAHVHARAVALRYNLSGVKSRAFCWRGPAPAVPDPEPKDMGLGDLPW